MPKAMRALTIFLMAFFPIILFAMSMPGDSYININAGPFEIIHTSQVSEIYFFLPIYAATFFLVIGLLLKSKLARFFVASLPVLNLLFQLLFYKGIEILPLLEILFYNFLFLVLSLFYFYRHPPSLRYYYEVT